MRKPLTGEPCAGKLHARFGGRGGRAPISTPISGAPLDSRLHGNECAREGVQTAWWKSVPGQAMTPKLKVTASSRGGVESNRKRTGSPQDNELDSAGWYDEPAHSWRSPEIVQYAGNGGQSDAEVHHVVGGGMLGSLYEISGETCRRSDGGRSQRPNSTDAAGKRARGVGSKTILREVGQEERGSAGGFKRPTNGK
jgi:hypothetical protein